MTEISVQIGTDLRRFNEAMARVVALRTRVLAEAAERIAPPPKEPPMPPLSSAARATQDAREAVAEEARASAALNSLYDTCMGVLRALDDATSILGASMRAGDEDVMHARGVVEGAALALRGTLGVLPDEST